MKIKTLVLAGLPLLSGCSVIGAGVALTSAAVTVGSAVVSTAVTVGSVAVRGVVKAGEVVVDAASSPAAEPVEELASAPAAPAISAEAMPIDLGGSIDQRELPNSPPRAERPCCNN